MLRVVPGLAAVKIDGRFRSVFCRSGSARYFGSLVPVLIGENMKKRTVWINIGAIAVVLAVSGWIGYTGMSRVRSVDIRVTPETLPPDGRSEARVQVRFINLFGFGALEKKTVRFEIVEGREYGTIVAATAQSARVRSTLVPGRIVLYVSIQGTPMPYEIIIPVRPNYALQ